jgi:peptide/nickel transport system substrate-binding protein
MNAARISLAALCISLILPLATFPLASSRSDIVFDWDVTPTTITIPKNWNFDVAVEVKKISGEGFVQIRILPSLTLQPSKELIISEYFDGNQTAKASVQVTALWGGNHTLTVEALVGDDVSNLKHRDERIISVHVPYPLRASISTSTTRGDAPLTITFTPNVTGGTPPYTYQWISSDGFRSTESNPTHTFEEPGYYRVTMNMKDSAGIGYTALQIITVTKNGEVYNPIRTAQNLTKGVANAPLNATYAPSNESAASSGSNAVGNAPSNIPNGGRCLIATAAFGSELAPQVQFLREFRDKHIMSTASGSSFMNVFNAWYYSFSPYVADYEREQPWMQQIVKVSVYPLLGILQVSENAYSLMDGEYGALMAGLLASSLIGVTYFSPLVLAIKPVRQHKFTLRNVFVMFGVALAVVFVGIISNNTVILAFSTVSLILSVLAISAIGSAKLIHKYIVERRWFSSLLNFGHKYA